MFFWMRLYSRILVNKVFFNVFYKLFRSFDEWIIENGFRKTSVISVSSNQFKTRTCIWIMFYRCLKAICLLSFVLAWGGNFHFNLEFIFARVYFLYQYTNIHLKMGCVNSIQCSFQDEKTLGIYHYFLNLCIFL